MIHFVDLPSFRSLNAVMQSGATDTLERHYLLDSSLSSNDREESGWKVVVCDVNSNCLDLMMERRTLMRPV